MKKSTKTITYHASINNGSFFQAYALQKTLLELGCENEILDIQTPELKSDYALFRNNRCVTDIAKNAISLLHFSGLKSRKEKFEQARRDCLIMSREYESFDFYLKDNVISDDCLFIAGSDQIWNTTASDFTEGYFLPGIKNKITYSVSGGTHITDSELKKYQEHIVEFKKLSAREDDLKQTLCKMGISDVEVTLDPTLLLNKEDYLRFMSSTQFIKGRYIFLYSVKCDSEVLKFAKRVSRQIGLPVYTIFNTYRSEKNRLYGVKNIYDAGPFDFLNIINNAEFVLSDSFHGNVFAILMEKEFYYISKTDADGQLVRDDRIDSLLEILGLEERRISCKSLFSRKGLEKIVLEKMLKKIQLLRTESIDYLRDAIKN